MILGVAEQRKQMNLTSKKDEKGKVRRKEDEIKKKIAPKKNKKQGFGRNMKENFYDTTPKNTRYLEIRRKYQK